MSMPNDYPEVSLLVGIITAIGLAFMVLAPLIIFIIALKGGAL